MEPHTDLLKVEHTIKAFMSEHIQIMRWDEAQTHSALIFKCDEDVAQLNLD